MLGMNEQNGPKETESSRRLNLVPVQDGFLFVPVMVVSNSRKYDVSAALKGSCSLRETHRTVEDDRSLLVA